MFQMSNTVKNVECEQFLTILSSLSLYRHLSHIKLYAMEVMEYCRILIKNVITSNLQIFHVYLLSMSSLAAKVKTYMVYTCLILPSHTRISGIVFFFSNFEFIRLGTAGCAVLSMCRCCTY